eukprot:7691329-Heterocapsa_arctica.AAC.1
MVQTRGDTGNNQDKYLMLEDLDNKAFAMKQDKLDYRKHRSNKLNKEGDIVECIMASRFIWQNTGKSYVAHAYSRGDKHADKTANGR